MGDKNNDKPPNDDARSFWSSDWIEHGKQAQARNRVFSEFMNWIAEVKDVRLVEKASQLWHLLLDDGLSTAKVAAIIAALLYCITPLDICFDFIPILGLADDLLVVLSVLTYVGHKDTK